jgi:hypothetical protein
MIRQGIIKVGAHPDFTPVLAEYPFLGHLINRNQFNLGLILMANDNVFTLFGQANQFEKASFRLFNAHNFRRHHSYPF